MKKFAFFSVLSLLICSSISLRWGLSHITLNSSISKSTISVSLSTDIKEPFTIESASFINGQNHIALITPNQEDNLLIQPLFISDQQTLYNDFSQNEYWLGFKKTYQVDGEPLDLADFDLMKVHIEQKTFTMLVPQLGLPLTFINVNSLSRCENVLISYQIIDEKISLSVFSKQQTWMVKPDALWGFRHHDNDIFYGRSVHAASDIIQIFVDQNKYCVLQSHNLPKNSNPISEGPKLSLEYLLEQTSAKLETRQSKAKENPTSSEL